MGGCSMSFERSGTRRHREGACANGAAKSAAHSETAKPSRKRPIPLTVVGGDFGAGKTTVLGALVAADPGTVAVLFYDTLGGAEVDATLLGARCRLSDVATSCLCCTSHIELLDALVRLRTSAAPPQHVYVEVNGDCDPWMVFARGMASG